MNVIKAIIAAALVLAFAAPEAGAAGPLTLTLEKGETSSIPTMFGDKKGLAVFWRLDEYNTLISEFKEGWDMSNNERVKEGGKPIPFNEDMIVFAINGLEGGTFEKVCYENYGLKSAELEYIRTDSKSVIWMGYPESLDGEVITFDHDVAKLIVVCSGEAGEW